jgi:hypothetical protein
MSLAIQLQLPPGVTFEALLSALSLPVGGNVAEVGLPATGATAALLADGDGSTPGPILLVPLVRAPWLADDVIRPIQEVIASLGGSMVPEDPVAAFFATRRQTLLELMALCSVQGVPPPPHMSGADLEALHQWLLALAYAPPGPPVAPTIFCLDPRDGTMTRAAVRVPSVDQAPVWRAPTVDGVLVDLAPADPNNERPLLFPFDTIRPAVSQGEDGFFHVDTRQARALLAAARDGGAGEGTDRFRLVAPVEVVDVESLQ